MSNAPQSFNVATTLAAYHIVKMGSAGNGVVYATSATDFGLGITVDDVKNTTDSIPVAITGIAKLQFNDTCAIGAFVQSDATGLGVPAVVTTAGIYVIGILVGPAVSATGTIADVLINPMQRSIP